MFDCRTSVTWIYGSVCVLWGCLSMIKIIGWRQRSRFAGMRLRTYHTTIKRFVKLIVIKCHGKHEKINKAEGWRSDPQVQNLSLLHSWRRPGSYLITRVLLEHTSHSLPIFHVGIKIILRGDRITRVWTSAQQAATLKLRPYGTL